MVSAIGLLATTVGAVLVLATDADALHQYGSARLFVILIPPSMVILMVFPVLGVKDKGSAHPLSQLAHRVKLNRASIFFFFVYLLPSLIGGVALAPLLNTHVALYIAAIFIWIFIFHLGPLLSWVDRGRRYDIWRPNPYTDLYDEPESQLWVVVPATTTPRHSG